MSPREVLEWLGRATRGSCPLSRLFRPHTRKRRKSDTRGQRTTVTGDETLESRLPSIAPKQVTVFLIALCTIFRDFLTEG